MAKQLSRAFFCLALFLTFFVTAEIAARVEDRIRLGVGWLAVPDHDRDLVVHDSVAIRGRPHGRFKKWKLNSFGFRNAEMTMQPTEGCTRVMVLGASETFGLYESPGKEYPAQLESMLRHFGCYEVVNAAVAGLPVRAIIKFWRGWASRFAPDIVAVYPTPGFYLSNRAPAYPQPPTVSPPEPSWWNPRLVDRAKDVIEMPAFLHRRLVARALARETRSEPGWSFESVPDARLGQFRDDLRLLVQSVESTGALPVLLTHATGFGQPPRLDEYDALDAWRQFTPRASVDVLRRFEILTAESIIELAKEQHAAVIDVASRMNGRREWFADDFLHFNNDGAAIVAGLVGNYILSDPVARVHLMGRQHRQP